MNQSEPDPHAISDEIAEEIEGLLRELEGLDPAELPEPASRLATLLEQVLERSDEN